MSTVRLDQWAVVYTNDDPYTPPEFKAHKLSGVVSGHPFKPNGTKVITSRIVDSDGRFVTTRSGTVYELGEAADEYKAYLKEEGRLLDSTQPIKVK